MPAVDSPPALELLPLAAIDIGSNSMRLEIGQIRRGRYRRSEYLKQTVRLGAGLDPEGRLTEDAMHRGLECLRGFARHLAGFNPAHLRAVATQTLREAANRNEFLALAEAELGHPIEVISGREEARLIYCGVAALQPSQARRLVIDIGGRSTELILGDGSRPLVAESFPVGSVGLSQRYFEGGRITAAAFRAAQVAAGAHFEELLSTFSPERWTEVLGSSGTIGAVAGILQARGRADACITPAALAELIEHCTAAGHVSHLQLAGLRDDRRAVLPGGLAILYTLAVHFGLTELRPAKGALRHGMLFDLHARLHGSHAGGEPPDVRNATVAEFQARFTCDRQQAARVRSVALALFDMVMPDAEPHHRLELAWVCDLHEIGMAISHHDYHRHSAYLLANLDAPGFSQSQQRRLADLALAQRGGLRKIDALLQRTPAAWQVLCLRLAVIRCHSRLPLQSPQLRLLRRAERAAWLGWHPPLEAADPRTLYLLGEELQEWARGTALQWSMGD
jgi:exopolyphosphatase / guanosine-5'-triphosphate,3'-diphosphate pyrophosphatase